MAIGVIAVVMLAFTMGHGDGCCSHGEEVLGPATEATCPPSSTLTYENFGKPFVEAYCTDCHSSELTGDDRNGAPAHHDFDTLVGIKSVANHVDQAAAAGPAATNDAMPPEDPVPTLEERQQLAEWISCGLR